MLQDFKGWMLRCLLLFLFFYVCEPNGDLVYLFESSNTTHPKENLTKSSSPKVNVSVRVQTHLLPCHNPQ